MGVCTGTPPVSPVLPPYAPRCPTAWLTRLLTMANARTLPQIPHYEKFRSPSNVAKILSSYQQ